MDQPPTTEAETLERALRWQRRRGVSGRGWAYLGQSFPRGLYRAKIQGFAILALAVLAAFFYEVSPANGIIWCPFRLLTGHECGGCGLTRSWCALADGEFSLAMAFNPFGPLLYSLAILKVGILGVEVRTRRQVVIPVWDKVRVYAVGALVAAMFVFTVHRIYQIF